MGSSRDSGLLEAKSFRRNDVSLPGFLERKLMDNKQIGLVVGVLTVAVAFMSFNSYVSVTSASGAASSTSAFGSLSVAIISLIIACGLFAKYFGLIK